MEQKSASAGEAASRQALSAREQNGTQPMALFTRETKAIVWGMQARAVQGMLDFDYVCSRKNPSVVAMIYPFV